MEVGLVCWRTLDPNVKQHVARSPASTMPPRLVFRELWAAYQILSNTCITSFSFIFCIWAIQLVSSSCFLTPHPAGITNFVVICPCWNSWGLPSNSVAEVSSGPSLRLTTTII